MGDVSYSTRKGGTRLPQALKDRMEQMLMDGEIVADIARQCGVSTYSVIKLARAKGIDYKRCPPGGNFGKHIKASKPKPVMTYAQDIQGWMYALRWGGGHGS